MSGVWVPACGRATKPGAMRAGGVAAVAPITSSRARPPGSRPEARGRRPRTARWAAQAGGFHSIVGSLQPIQCSDTEH